GGVGAPPRRRQAPLPEARDGGLPSRGARGRDRQEPRRRGGAEARRQAAPAGSEGGSLAASAGAAGGGRAGRAPGARGLDRRRGGGALPPRRRAVPRRAARRGAPRVLRLGAAVAQPQRRLPHPPLLPRARAGPRGVPLLPRPP